MFSHARFQTWAVCSENEAGVTGTIGCFVGFFCSCELCVVYKNIDVRVFVCLLATVERVSSSSNYTHTLPPLGYKDVNHVLEQIG